jgi:NTE family protein
VSLVIGSGGVKCAAAIGLWSVLAEEGIEVGSIVACSGGSLYGAAIAQGWDSERMRSLSESLWTADVMQGYRENLKASKDGSLKFNDRSGLVDDSVLNQNLELIYGDLTFSDLGLPLKLVATDLHRGEKVVLESGLVRDAIRASIAIPIIFPPWEINGQVLIDGGASDPLPVDVAIQDGSDIIIAMGFTLGYRTRFRSMTAVQEQLTSIYTNTILNATYAFHNLAHHAEIFPIVPEFDEQVSMFDVAMIPAVIEKGEQATREQLPHILRAIEAVG